MKHSIPPTPLKMPVYICEKMTMKNTNIFIFYKKIVVTLWTPKKVSEMSRGHQITL